MKKIGMVKLNKMIKYRIMFVMSILAFSIVTNICVIKAFERKGLETGIIKEYATSTNLETGESTNYRVVKYDYMKRTNKGNYFVKENGVIYEFDSEYVQDRLDRGLTSEYIKLD